jgi:hypothetical protein
MDKFGNLYIADYQNSTIRRAQPLTLTARRKLPTPGVVISWPLVATGFVLEASASLAPGSPWMTISNGFGVSGDRYALTNNASGPSAFYRLRK